MSFFVNLFTIKGNLFFMRNHYHKVAVASLCTALSVTFGANQEAKAATLVFESTTFFIEERSPYFPHSDEREYSLYTNNMNPNYSHNGHSFTVGSTPYVPYGVQRSFHEFSIDNLSFIESAIFSIQSDDWESSYNHPYLQIFGYVGNGRADLSDYNAGESLGIQRSNSSRARINFDVTQFVNERVSNRDAFVGFSIRLAEPYQNNNSGTTAHINNTYYQPLLTIETTDVAQPVPEPTTIFGSTLALGVGAWLKRKKSSQQNKTTSQH
jgi:hypothetical protein